MNLLIEQWQNAEQDTAKARVKEAEALQAACAALPPEQLRPAEPKDIIEGAIIWYPHMVDDPEFDDPLYECSCWERVEEVLHPNDDWKAYSSHSGCRYGLREAFVEATKKQDY